MSELQNTQEPPLIVRSHIKPEDPLRKKVTSALRQVFVDTTTSPDVSLSIKALTAPDTAKYDRLVYALTVLRSGIPDGLHKSIKKALNYSQESMPFSPDDYHLVNKLGQGGVNEVFLLESKSSRLPSYALKVQIVSGDSPNLEKLLAILEEQKKEFEEIRHAFEYIEDVIPPEYHLVIHGPKEGTPAAVMLQPFVNGRIRDLYHDIPKNELEKLLRDDHLFAQQFGEFFGTLAHNPDLLEKHIDLTGYKNLSVVSGADGHEQLLFLDPHFVPSEHEAPRSYDDILERFNYFEEIRKDMVHAETA